MDSTHSWIAAGAGSVVCLLIMLPVRLGAQFFVSMLDHFGTTRKDASFPFALASLMRCSSGPFAGILGEKYGFQKVILAGCLLSAVGVGACFFAEDLITFNICFGIIYGIGLGWSSALLPVVINQHFDKHKAKALGICCGGGGIGSFLAPPLIEIVLNDYGISGTFLIMGAILLNGVPAAIFMRKPRLDLTDNSIINTSEKLESLQAQNLDISVSSSNQCKCTDNTTKIISDVKWHFNSCYKCQNNLRTVPDNIMNHTPLVPIKKMTLYDTSWAITKSNDEKNVNSNSRCAFSELDHSISTFNDESEIIPGIQKQMDEVLLSTSKLTDQYTLDCNFENTMVIEKKYNASLTTKLSKKTRLFHLFNKMITPFHVLCKPIFLLISFTNGMHMFLNCLFWTITVDYVREKKVEQYLEIYFVMGLSLFDIFGRFFLGSIADCGIISASHYSAILMTATGLLCLSLTWASKFLPVLFLICSLGLVFGANISVQPVVVQDLIQKEKISMAISSRFILYVPMSFAMSPLIDYFKGTLGSYNGLMYCVAFFSIICGIILFLLPRFAKHGKTKYVIH